MITKEEINNRFITCISHVTEDEHFEATFDDVAKKAINEISEYSKTTKLFKENYNKGEKMFKNERITLIWKYLLNRIISAPTEFHRTCSIILIAPFIDEKLTKRKE